METMRVAVAGDRTERAGREGKGGIEGEWKQQGLQGQETELRGQEGRREGEWKQQGLQGQETELRGQEAGGGNNGGCKGRRWNSEGRRGREGREGGRVARAGNGTERAIKKGETLFPLALPPFIPLQPPLFPLCALERSRGLEV